MRRDSNNPTVLLLGMAALLTVFGCSRCTKSGVTDDPNTGGPEDPRQPDPVPPDHNDNNHPVTPVSAPGPHNPGKVGPRRLPTFVKLDYAAFPNPRGGKHGSSGRQIAVRPGKPGAISAALEKAKPGDTLVLEGGTYKEPLDTDDHRALLIEKDGIVIRTKPGKRAKIVPRSSEVNTGAVIKSSYVMLQGLDIEGFSSVAVLMENEGQVIKHIVMADINVTMPVDGKWHDGIIVGHDNRAIKKPANDGLLLTNVTVHGSSLGISCNSGPCRNWWLENVKVEKMSKAQGDADAIAVAEGDNMVFIGTEVSGASADGIDLKASRVVVWNCYAHNLLRNGVKLWHGGDIVNTVIHHTGADAAIVFEHKGRYRVLHSLVAYHNYPKPSSYNLSSSYDSKDNLRVEIINSIFYKTSGGMFIQEGTKATIKNSLFYDIRNKTYVRWMVGDKEREVTNAAGLKRYGTNNRITDPRFKAERKGDFTLKRSSPGVNAGIVVKDYPPLDYRGRKRVQGSKPDIGPFECY